MLRPDMILQRSINAAIAETISFDDNTDLQMPNSTVSNGAIAAALISVQNAFGSGFKFVGLKDGIEFLRMRFDTGLELVGSELRLPSANVIELASNTTLVGNLVGRLVNGSLKIEGTLGKTLADFVLGKDVVSGESVDTSGIALRFNRGLDPGGGATGLALVPAKAGGYSVTENEYKRLFGPGLQHIDALANLVVGNTATENRVYFRFKAPISGPVSSIQTYWATGGGGYAAGTGGTMSLRVFPDDGSAGHRPNVLAASFSNGSLSGQLAAGAFTGAHTFYEPVAMTSVTDLVAGQIYHVEFRNTDGAPGTNYISANCSVVVTANGDGNNWLSPSDWGVIFASRTIGSGSVFTMDDFTVNPNPTATNLKYRPILFVTIAGQKFGDVELESGNRNENNPAGHPYIWTVTNAAPIREQVTLTSTKTISGFSIWAAASVAGTLNWEIGTGASVVRSGSIVQATANFSTVANFSVQQGVYTRYDVELIPPLTVNSGALHNHMFQPVGGSAWKFADDYPGDYAYVGAWNQSKAQSFETGAWLDANHRNHTIVADQRSNLRMVYHEAPASAPVGGGGATNSLDLVANDMRLNNDFVLAGYESQTVGWYINAQVQFGATMNTDHAPQWWKDLFPAQVPWQLKAILPWIVMHKASGEPNRNVRIYLKNFRCYYLRADTNVWVQIGSSAGASGFNTPKIGLFAGNDGENKRTNSDGSVEIYLPDNPSQVWHGWWDAGRPNIDYLNIGAIHATCQYKLVTDNPSGPNDLAVARYGLHLGTDYYPDSATNWPNFAPGAGVSRAKFADSTLRSISMTTFTNLGVQDPGNSGITEAQFRANPPPLD